MAACAEPGCRVEAPRPEEPNVGKRDITPGQGGCQGPGRRVKALWRRRGGPEAPAGQGFCEDPPSWALGAGAPSLSCKRWPSACRLGSSDQT